MYNVISLSKLLDAFKVLNIELNEDEVTTINSVFSKVDKWNEEGKDCPSGDGCLNNKEFYLFSKLIQNTQSLYEKFTQMARSYSLHRMFWNLEDLFLAGEVDEDFIKNLSEDEIQELIHSVSFTTSYRLDQKKGKELFQIQLQLLKNSNCYTDDLEALVNQLLVEYPPKESDIKQGNLRSTLNSLKIHLNDRLNAAKSGEIFEIKEPNGKIDANFKQGDMGDCWLLSSIKAAASNEQYLEKLNNMISVQKDGEKVISVTVNLQGKNYIISNEELHAAIEYSTGDLDVRALEIAINRFCLENYYKDITTGGNSGLGYSILFDDKDKVKEFANMHPEDFFLNIDDLKTGNRIGTIGGAIPDTYAIDIETEEKIKLLEAHAYAIVDSDSEFIYLVDPHDSSKKLKLDINKIYSTFTHGYLYDTGKE